ncbi:MAG: hypothetical protein C0592_09920 [Marinilabiliales bacterium]|nr:MAG: hypothetical protein C0592_09920 [Marinilabiliales bacterium]
MHKKLIHIIIFIFLLLPGFGKAQDFKKTNEYSCGENVVYFTGDAFGNMFILYENGNFVRIDSMLTKSSLPGSKIIGEISVDTKNPFKIQLFNADEQSLTFYNQEFAPSNTISFLNLDIGEIILSCASSEDAFWVLEENGLNLIRYSSDLIKITESRGSELFNDGFNAPTGMQENGEFLLVWQKKGSAFVLDKFGNLRWEFPENADYYALDTPYLYFFKNQKLTAYSLLTHKEITIRLPLDEFNEMVICEKHFYFLKKGMIYHYKLQ